MEGTTELIYVDRTLLHILETEKENDGPGLNMRHVKRAYSFLRTINHERSLTKNDIITVNALIRNENVTDYRSTEVVAKGDSYLGRYAFSAFVPSLMSNWILDINEVNTNIEKIVKRFIDIHPFTDGNGRTAKLLGFYMSKWSWKNFLTYYFVPE